MCNCRPDTKKLELCKPGDELFGDCPCRANTMLEYLIDSLLEEDELITLMEEYGIPSQRECKTIINKMRDNEIFKKDDEFGFIYNMRLRFYKLWAQLEGSVNNKTSNNMYNIIRDLKTIDM